MMLALSLGGCLESNVFRHCRDTLSLRQLESYFAVVPKVWIVIYLSSATDKF